MPTLRKKVQDDRETCAECNDFKSLDDSVVTVSYGVCKKSGRAVDKSSQDCAVEEWHERYINRLMDIADVTLSQAEDWLEAGMGEYDYDHDPEDSADDEMSYWTE